MFKCVIRSIAIIRRFVITRSRHNLKVKAVCIVQYVRMSFNGVQIDRLPCKPVTSVFNFTEPSTPSKRRNNPKAIEIQVSSGFKRTWVFDISALGLFIWRIWLYVGVRISLWPLHVLEICVICEESWWYISEGPCHMKMRLPCSCYRIKYLILFILPGSLSKWWCPRGNNPNNLISLYARITLRYLSSRHELGLPVDSPLI